MQQVADEHRPFAARLDPATRLRETDAPLATVARETGYGSPYALSHAFSREFGITPSAYRGLRAA
ncbi:hypothetical protein AQJ11_11765 [Streptomyces corchorusii]|uniref:HTH araC/xylS-type domain-containing protein n=2 Tax=Streptomyces TaxID=1883 RepID=A0A124HNW9_STRCK|nr:helix-turn-helix domain-containing protein [Streptomyces corchorusii]AEY91143.1 hypothetical protein SHJG_5876 [Streptomyces hygroscopicus subsp. jinggangensis 5008]AGF65301.1 hypothetical protein SHJGH_5638 [Streptomyces hygroscopicus subsp. jinggangensis TL01]KUN30434.1 hypothetical protein AQJ11_11765 [Streptomyces corchorusii]